MIDLHLETQLRITDLAETTGHIINMIGMKQMYPAKVEDSLETIGIGSLEMNQSIIVTIPPIKGGATRILILQTRAMRDAVEMVLIVVIEKEDGTMVHRTNKQNGTMIGLAIKVEKLMVYTSIIKYI